MKFWQKLYLSTLLLLLFILNVSILTLSNSVYQNNLDAERERGNERAARMVRRISEDFASLEERETFNERAISSLLSTYLDDYSIQSAVFAVYYNGKTIYSNLGFDDPSLIPTEQLNEKPIILSRVYRIEEESDYCIYQSLEEYSGYGVLYLYKLANLNQLVTDLVTRSLVISVIGMITLAILLYVFVKKITAPLEKLEVAAKKIADGKYETRASVKGNICFGVLFQRRTILSL